MPTPLPQFFAGTYVTPRRAYRKKGRGTTPDELTDCNGRRSWFGQILDPIPAVVGTQFMQSWSSDDSLNHATSVTTFLYRVEVWDIDLHELVTDTYPETELLPGPSVGTASALHYDADALPADVAELAAALAASV